MMTLHSSDSGDLKRTLLSLQVHRITISASQATGFWLGKLGQPPCQRMLGVISSVMRCCCKSENYGLSLNFPTRY